MGVEVSHPHVRAYLHVYRQALFALLCYLQLVEL